MWSTIYLSPSLSRLILMLGSWARCLSSRSIQTLRLVHHSDGIFLVLHTLTLQQFHGVFGRDATPLGDLLTKSGEIQAEYFDVNIFAASRTMTSDQSFCPFQPGSSKCVLQLDHLLETMP